LRHGRPAVVRTPLPLLAAPLRGERVGTPGWPAALPWPHAVVIGSVPLQRTLIFLPLWQRHAQPCPFFILESACLAVFIIIVAGRRLQQLVSCALLQGLVAWQVTEVVGGGLIATVRILQARVVILKGRVTAVCIAVVGLLVA
jgi:hypothetical protein